MAQFLANLKVQFQQYGIIVCTGEQHKSKTNRKIHFKDDYINMWKAASFLWTATAASHFID